MSGPTTVSPESGSGPGETGLAPITDPRLITLGDEAAVPFAPAAITVIIVAALLVVAALGFLAFGSLLRLPGWAGVLPAAVPGAVFLVLLARAWLRYFMSAGAARRLLERHAGPSWHNRAVRAVVHARRRVWGRAIDAQRWFEEPAPAGPRPGVIAVGCVPRLVAGEEVWEPVEVGASRRSTPVQRRRVVRLAVVVVAWMTGMTILLMQMPVMYRWIMMFLFGFATFVQIVALLARLNITVVSFTSAIASPGRLEHASWGRVVEFTPLDSVVLAQGVPMPSLRWMSRRRRGRARVVVAWVVRRDGKRAALAFDHEADPGLSDLLTRWLAPSRGAP